MSQSHYVGDMKNNLLSFLSQRFAVLAIMSERACIKNRKQLAYGLIYSKLIFAIQFWSTCSTKQKKQIEILLNDTARLVMGIKERTSMRVKDLYRCLKWHTLESLINYHDYLLFWSIHRKKQPENLWLLYDENRAHMNANAEWNYPNSDGDPLKDLLNEGPVTRQRTMGNIRRNTATESKNALRFESFIPRSVRLYNRTPQELKHMGELDWVDFKRKLKWHCMELELGPRTDWPNYDEMNGRILPSHKELFDKGERIVKKRNGLFIEPIPQELRGRDVNQLLNRMENPDDEIT